jgi:hypothetical protein
MFHGRPSARDLARGAVRGVTARELEVASFVARVGAADRRNRLSKEAEDTDAEILQDHDVEHSDCRYGQGRCPSRLLSWLASNFVVSTSKIRRFEALPEEVE